MVIELGADYKKWVGYGDVLIYDRKYAIFIVEDCCTKCHAINLNQGFYECAGDTISEVLTKLESSLGRPKEIYESDKISLVAL